MTIASDIQKLNPGDQVELFELDATALGGGTYRFHSGTDELQASVVWQGNIYTAYPVEASGFEWSGTGPLPRPKLKLSNVFGLISGLCLQYADLVGAKLTRRRTLLKYLDAVNFSAGNANADPNAHFPDEMWFIDRKSGEDKIFAEFELAPAWDTQGVMLPRRQTVQNICSWKYRSAECSYALSTMYDNNDVVTTNPTLDSCSKKLSGCKVRFGAYAELPYGGFPACGLIR